MGCDLDVCRKVMRLPRKPQGFRKAGANKSRSQYQSAPTRAGSRRQPCDAAFATTVDVRRQGLCRWISSTGLPRRSPLRYFCPAVPARPRSAPRPQPKFRSPDKDGQERRVHHLPENLRLAKRLLLSSLGPCPCLHLKKSGQTRCGLPDAFARRSEHRPRR